MAMMFNLALQRMANGEQAHVLPTQFKKQVEGSDAARQFNGYELQWTERLGVDPEDFILCKYRVRDPDDVATIKQNLEKRTLAIGR